jgi:protein SCO1
LIQVKTGADFRVHISCMIRLSTALRPSSPLGFPALRFALLLCATLLIGACDRGSQVTNSSSRSYEVRGIVRGTAPDRKTIDVEHEDIRGFMPSMTMPFSVSNPPEVAGLQKGDAISFRLTVTDNDSSIDRIKKIGLDEVRLPVPSATPAIKSIAKDLPRLREGDVMPPFQLIDQDGKTISNENFRGRPFVLTFVFTRCPIPNFCPLMSKNFSILQKAIKGGSGTLAQTRLLSVSFDPDYDSPAVLKAYAEHEQADPAIWMFVTGEKGEISDLTQAFSVYVQPEGGTISHGLATALIDKDGKVDKIWRGNGWSPSEIVEALQPSPK